MPDLSDNPGAARKQLSWLTASTRSLAVVAAVLAIAAGCGGSGTGEAARPKRTSGEDGNAPAVSTPAPGTVSVAVEPPEQPAVGLEGEMFDKTPVRATSGLSLVKNGWTYDCMECHRTFETGWDVGRERIEHKHIVMDHGMNEYCANCHHPANKSAFVWYDGSEMPESEVVTLCAKCHGPQHRDWKAGVHGRRNGYWNDEMGSQTRLRCIQCHDPHSPAFKPLEPRKAPPRVGAAPDEFMITGKRGIDPLPPASHGEPSGH